jgi:O-methyltransferase
LSDGRWLARWTTPDHPIGRLLLRGRTRVELALWRPIDARDRALKRTIARLAPGYTMMSLARLRALAALAALIEREGVPGAIVECGTWRGGSLALVDWVLRAHGGLPDVWAFDSFEGLPAPGGRDPRAAREAFYEGWCRASEEDVRRAFAAAGADPSRVRAVRGWVAETLPRTDTGPIALLNVDVDWYDSVRAVLDHLYDRVAPQGVVNFDDYGRWSGCDAAVHDFLASRGLSPSALLTRTSRHGAWLRKPAA